MNRKYLLLHLIILLAVGIIMWANPAILSAQAEISIPAGMQSIKLMQEAPNPQDIPVRVVIPRINVSLNVEPSSVKGNTWEVQDEGASYAIQSSFLDEEFGNTILFAHARENMFKNLNQLKIGDKIQVFGQKGVYTYKVNGISQINPLEVDQVKSSGNDNLSLFTCDGPSDVYRLLVKAKRISQTQYSFEEVI